MTPKNNKSRWTLLALVAMLAGFGITSIGQPTQPVIHYTWTAPTTGSPVDHYVVQFEIDGVVADWPEPMHDENFYWEAYPYGQSLRIRVAGVDAQSRQGNYSPWSNLWTDHGPPGAPGQPQQTLELR